MIALVRANLTDTGLAKYAVQVSDATTTVHSTFAFHCLNAQKIWA